MTSTAKLDTFVSEVWKWSQEQGKGKMSNDALDNCVSEIWSDTKNIIANDKHCKIGYLCKWSMEVIARTR